MKLILPSIEKFHSSLIELGINDFIGTFKNNSDFIHEYTLRNLTLKESNPYYSNIKQLQVYFEENNSLLETLQIIETLPNIDIALSNIENSNANISHFFQLAKFIIIDHKINYIDKINTSLIKAEKTLSRYFNDDYTMFLYPVTIDSKIHKIQILQEKSQASIKILEKNIYDQFGIEIFFPFPKQITISKDQISDIEQCTFLDCEKIDTDFYQLNLIPQDSFDTEINALQQIINEYTETMIAELNLKLLPDINLIYKEIQLKKNIYLQISLIYSAQKHNLIFPTITEQSICEYSLQEFIPPSMNSKHYIPLSIDLSKGAHVIYGGNMTGKTTTLKSIYFSLMLVKWGIPIPANNLTLSFPREVRLHLKSSGSLKKGESSYTEELKFFEHSPLPNDFIIADEIFGSTFPKIGSELTKIFLQYFKDLQSIFLCTSFYQNIFNQKDIRYYQMQESVNIDKDNKSFPTYLIHELKDDKNRSKHYDEHRSLRIALQYKLPEQIKIRINQRLIKKDKKR
ncbi:hypothetical protein OAB57_00900 [Bacteriovoracaceae bacterium]|nr:hypothetical protein [Bacteriovoracaceae bacterium]